MGYGPITNNAAKVFMQKQEAGKPENMLTQASKNSQGNSPVAAQSNTESNDAVDAMKAIQNEEPDDEILNVIHHESGVATWDGTTKPSGMEATCIDNIGMEEAFILGVSYLAEKHDDDDMLWVIDRLGEKRECYKERFELEPEILTKNEIVESFGRRGLWFEAWKKKLDDIAYSG